MTLIKERMHHSLCHILLILSIMITVVQATTNSTEFATPSAKYYEDGDEIDRLHEDFAALNRRVHALEDTVDPNNTKINTTAQKPEEFVLKKCLNISDPNQKLFDAVDGKNVTNINILIHCDETDINTMNSEWKTPLLVACNNDQAQVVKVLLSHPNIDVNAMDWIEGMSGLQMACWYGYSEVAWLLLQSPEIDVNDVDMNGQTPLLLASEDGHTEIASMLLDHPDIDINKVSFGLTALSNAATKGHSKFVKTLLSRPETDINKADSLGRTALHWASYFGDTEVIRLLLERPDIDINKEGTFEFGTISKKKTIALHLAAYYGYSEIVKMILQRPETDVNRATHDGETSLFMASRRGQSEVVTLLLKNTEIEINKASFGTTSLWKAAESGYTDIVQLIIENPITNLTHGITTNTYAYLKIANLVFAHSIVVMDSDEELIVATMLGNLTKIKSLLLRNETNVNFCDRYERTSLFWASTRVHHEVVKLLLTHPETLVNMGRSTDGATALHQASKSGQSEIVELLIKHPKLDVNAALITNGATALFIASQLGYEEVVRSLLSHPQIDFNKGTLNRQTPLMTGSMYGNSNVVKLLLATVSIDVNYATIDGKTALFYAVSKKEPETLELILRCPKTNTNLVDEEYKTALARAKESNLTELVNKFNLRGSLQIISGHTCCSDEINRGIHIAVTNGDLTWIKTFLVCPKLDINVHSKNGFTPLNVAIRGGLKEIVNILLQDPRTDVNKPNTAQRKNAILIASENGHIDIMRLLLLHSQTFVNQEDSKGQTALSVALQGFNSNDANAKIRKYYRIVKLLLRCPKTIVPNRLIEEFTSVLKLKDDVKQILDIRSDLIEMMASCCRNVKQGIFTAAWTGDFRAIRGLLECPGTEININSVDKKGRTPLYIAAMMGHLKAVEVLISNTYIDANIGTSFDGKTAICIASEKAHVEVMKQLIINGDSNENKGWSNDDWTKYAVIGKLNHAPPPTTTNSSSPTKPGTPTCNSTYFRCSSAKTQCIPWQWVCDGDSECGDASDESTELCHASGKCGGNFYSQIGLITSPLFPNKYPNNADCVYTISQSNYTHVSVTVVTFSLFDNIGCYDFLEIRDGDSKNSKLMGKFCGKNIPKQITSSKNHLQIRFKSDSNRNELGFQIIYNGLDHDGLSQDTCMKEGHGSYRNFSGILISPSYPNAYPPGLDCIYVISQPNGSIVNLTFMDIDIDCQEIGTLSDYFEMRNGMSEESPIMGIICGNGSSLPTSIQTTQRYLRIRFKSNYFGNGTGFKLRYEASESSTWTYSYGSCGGNFMTLNGFLNSPSYPDNYPDNVKCDYIISQPTGMYVNLTILMFDTYDIDCETTIFSDEGYDYLEIRDGNSEKSPLIGRFCGNNIPSSLHSTSNYMWIRFVSYEIYKWSSSNGPGFQIIYSAHECAGVNGTICSRDCGGLYSDASGSLVSPYYPNPYRPHEDCVYLISLPNGTYVNLSIITMDIVCQEIFQAGSDFIEMRDGLSKDSPLMGRFCGNESSIPTILQTTQNHLRMRFKSNYFEHGLGFKFEYESTDNSQWSYNSGACGGEFTTPYGIITSPSFPKNYPNNSDCVYTISQPGDTLINLRYLMFDIDSNYGVGDYLEIRDGDLEEAPIMATLGDSETIPPMRTTGNKVRMRFISDEAREAKGFQIEYYTQASSPGLN